MERKSKVAIFGAGKVGVAMAAEMKDAPVVRRGQDLECDVACVCWPAHAVHQFQWVHPLAARAIKVSFCNGVWGVADGMDHAGICYVRAVTLGDRAEPGRKAWRVGSKDLATVLRGAGLGVVCSTEGWDKFLWEKALYIIPLALACAELPDVDAKRVVSTREFAEAYNAVREAAVRAIGEHAVVRREPRVNFLCSRSPRGWKPSCSREEIEYFRRRICAD